MPNMKHTPMAKNRLLDESIKVDTGHGGSTNVIRTVRELEQASLLLEDQVFPKRCGHMMGKQVIEPAEMVPKIEIKDMAAV